MNICITRFGIHIGDRKYLNEYTPFGSVSLCFVKAHWPVTLTTCCQPLIYVEKLHRFNIVNELLNYIIAQLNGLL